MSPSGALTRYPAWRHEAPAGYHGSGSGGGWEWSPEPTVLAVIHLPDGSTHRVFPPPVVRAPLGFRR